MNKPKPKAPREARLAPKDEIHDAETVGGIAGEFTDNATKAARDLSLAGLAAVWLFKVSLSSDFALPAGLALPTLFFVLALGLDFLYWSLGAILWRLDYRFFQDGIALKPWELKLRKVILKRDDFGSAEFRTLQPTSIILWLLLLSVLVGWLCLMYFLFGRVNFTEP